MDIWGFFGLMAFLLAVSNASRIGVLRRRLDEGRRAEERPKRGNGQDMAGVLAGLIGKDIELDFYEDEESADMLDHGKYTRYTLLDVDEQWALLRVQLPAKTYERLIRLSSVKAVSEKQ